MTADWERVVVLSGVGPSVDPIGGFSVGNVEISSSKVSNVLSNVSVFGNVGIIGGAKAANLVVLGFVDELRVKGNLRLLTNIDVTNVYVSCVDTVVDVRGNVGLTDADPPRAMTISSFSTPFEVEGSVGIDRNSGNLFANSAVFMNVVDVVGNAVFSSYSTSDAYVSNSTARANVVGNILYSNEVRVANVIKARFVENVRVVGDVVATEVPGAKEVETASTVRANVNGNLGTSGDVSLSYVSGQTLIYGNAYISQISVSSVQTPVRIYGNVSFANSVAANFFGTMTISGNAVVPAGQVVVVSNVTSRSNVYGNVTLSNLFVSNVYGQVYTTGNVCAKIDVDMSKYDDLAGRIRTTDGVRIARSSCLGPWLPYASNVALAGYGHVGVDNTTNTSFILQTRPGSSGWAVYDTRNYALPNPGVPMVTYQTFKFSPSPETTSSVQVGVYDDLNGVFLSSIAGKLEFVRRSTTGSKTYFNDNSVPRSSWNIDRLDGTGPSGIVLDANSYNTLVTEWLWDGVAMVRLGFDFGGKVVYAHSFTNINSSTGQPFITDVRVPLRWGSVANSATSAYYGNVTSTGGSVFFDSAPFTGVPGGFAWKTTLSAAGTNYMTDVFSIRMGSGYSLRKCFLNLRNVSVALTTPGYLVWHLCLNVPADKEGTWRSKFDATIEFSTDRVSNLGVVGLTNFPVIASGVSSTDAFVTDLSCGERLLNTIGNRIGLGSDVLTMLAYSLTAGAYTLIASLNWDMYI